MDIITIVKRETLPSTTNAWGFGGAIMKERIVMSNGDAWVTGNACYRHRPDERYIQAKFGCPEFTGGLSADIDVLLRTSPDIFIRNHYNNNL